MWKHLIKLLRPHQWVKNVFLFAAMVFDRKLTNLHAFTLTLAGAVVFSVLASAVYVLNDIADRDADASHPVKRNRPIASGAIRPQLAYIIALILLVVGLPLAWVISPIFFLVCMVYIALNISYSFSLKHVPVIDVFVLASFYLIRVWAGVVLVDVQEFSPWLYMVTGMLALFIGFSKRRSELVNAPQNHAQQRRSLANYSLETLDQYITITAAITIFTYSLYTFSANNLPQNNIMMMTIPFVIYGIFRYVYLVRSGFGSVPEELLFKDKGLLLAVFLYIIAVLIIFYIT